VETGKTLQMSESLFPQGATLVFGNDAVFDDSRKKRVLRHLAIKRWGETEEIGDAAVFLASSKEAYITEQTLSVAASKMASSCAVTI
jgi:NAD(P)-dependent dehydrogenase (short-subunit alcohol dehydrogenase family)